MELTHPPVSGPSVSSSCSKAASVLRPAWLSLAPAGWALGLLSCVLPAQKPSGFGQNCEPQPGPPGYPPQLIAIPPGFVKIGISQKDAREIAKEFSHGHEPTQETFLRLLVRELGSYEVFVPGFLLGQHEVTNKEYEAFVKAKWPKVRFPLDWWIEQDLDEHRKAFYQKNKEKRGVSFKPQEYWAQNYTELKWEVPKGRERFPVTYVSYREAQAYCNWAGLRLPYETEWQLALQGTGKKPQRYLWGEKFDKQECLALLGYKTQRDAKKRIICSAPAARSCYGVDDLLGNVWEWTQSPFLAIDGWDKEVKALQRHRRKGKKKEVTLPLWRADKFMVRGGSFNSHSQAGIVFRSNTRMPLSVSQTVEDLGFRVCKSLVPALDATSYLGRTTFNADCLNDHALDLPSARETRQGTSRTYEQRGIERWIYDGAIIKSYRFLSFVPVTAVKYRSQKELGEASRLTAKDGEVGVPIAAIFSSVPFSVQQGLNKSVALDADLYAVSFRDKGLPRDLELALYEGARVLKVTKGVRPDPGKPEEEPKKDKKNKKKGKKSASQHRKKIDWMKIVDRYGIPDEVTMKFSKGNPPEEFLIHPGKLKIPGTKKKILLFRKHDGDYVAWAEYLPGVHPRSVSSSKPALTLRGGKLEYKGGPRTLVSSKRFEFKIQLLLPESEANQNWITPQTVAETKTGLAGSGSRRPAVKAKPKGASGRSNRRNK